MKGNGYLIQRNVLASYNARQRRSFEKDFNIKSKCMCIVVASKNIELEFDLRTSFKRYSTGAFSNKRKK